MSEVVSLPGVVGCRKCHELHAELMRAIRERDEPRQLLAALQARMQAPTELPGLPVDRASATHGQSHK